MKRHDYLPFGEELPSQGLRSASTGYAVGDGLRQQFTSEERDVETGSRLRTGALGIPLALRGRFTGADPPLSSGTSTSLNPQSVEWLYAYVREPPAEAALIRPVLWMCLMRL